MDVTYPSKALFHSLQIYPVILEIDKPDIFESLINLRRSLSFLFR